MKSFKGFTLTELMVALTVIGILVAVVTPAIMKTRPNKNKMMVKKSFYTVEQIVNSLINDEQLYPDMRDVCKNSAADEGNNIYCAWGFDYDSKVEYEGSEYEGKYKFAALFKDRLNVAKNSNDGRESSVGPDKGTFYPVFYTNDGIKWDLRGTKDAWTSKKSKPGTFEDQGNNTAGMGTISIDVNGDEGPNTACVEDANDCDQYEVQILATGKTRINPDHPIAVEYATINTSIRDAL
jgi:prepilin-type N-terminal cleavage/methylation domain-containing protein